MTGRSASSPRATAQRIASGGEQAVVHIGLPLVTDSPELVALARAFLAHDDALRRIAELLDEVDVYLSWVPPGHAKAARDAMAAVRAAVAPQEEEGA